MKKDNTFFSITIGVIGIVVVLVVGFLFISTIVDSQKDTLTPECTKMCKSNHNMFYKVTAGGYQNSVCYCKDTYGSISTMVM